MQNSERFEKFVISQKGLLIRDNKALIMEMEKYPGVWDLPGGRIEVGEDGQEAFIREIKEEMGIKNFVNLGVAHYHVWHVGESQTPVCGIVNLIENNDEEIVISEEHLNFIWIIDESDIDEYVFIWPEMPNALRQGFLKNRLLKKI